MPNPNPTRGGDINPFPGGRGSENEGSRRLTFDNTRMGEHALGLLSPASSGADPATRAMPTHKLTAVLEKMRIGMIQHPSSNGGSRVIAVTICSPRGARARGASHNGMAFSPRPGPRTTRTVQKAFIGRAEVLPEKDVPSKPMPTTVKASSIVNQLADAIRIQMEIAGRLRQPLILWDMFQAALQASDLPALLPVTLRSAALHTKDSTRVNRLKHVAFSVHTRRRGNVPRRRRLLAQDAKARKRGQGHRVPAANVSLPNINQPAVDSSNKRGGGLKPNPNDARVPETVGDRRRQTATKGREIAPHRAEEGAIPRDVKHRFDIKTAGALGRPVLTTPRVAVPGVETTG